MGARRDGHRMDNGNILRLMERYARGLGSSLALTLGARNPAMPSATFGNDCPLLMMDDSQDIFLTSGNERLNDDRRLKQGRTLRNAGIAGADGTRQGRTGDVRCVIAKAVFFGDALELRFFCREMSTDPMHRHYAEEQRP